MIRVGQGWDSHCLAEGRALRLGGVMIAFDRGLLGHSDADVLLHAVIDALLGAAGLPDIGSQFPDTDPAYAEISSLTLLERAGAALAAAGWQVVNIDSTVVAQQPRLTPYLDRMRANIAAALAVPMAQVSVKAKTAEGLGPAGQGRSMEAMAVVLVEQG